MNRFSFYNISASSLPTPHRWKIRINNPLVARVQIPKFTFLRKNPFRFSLQLGEWIAILLYISLLVLLIPFFFQFVEPSLIGNSSWRIGADTDTYLAAAGLLSGRQDAALLSFSANLFGPVYLAKLLHDNFRIMLFNYFMVAGGIFFLAKDRTVNRLVLMLLVLANPITLTSILTLNKEVFAMVGVAIFANYLVRPSPVKLLLAVSVSMLARWEQALMICGFLLITTEGSPFRKHPKLTTLLVVAIVSVLFPIAWSKFSFVLGAQHLQGHLIVTLVHWQSQGLFFVVLVPKLIMMFYGNFLNFPLWLGYRSTDWFDLQNTFVMLASNCLMLVLTIVAYARRRRDWFYDKLNYFLILYSIFLAIAPFMEHRYAYPVYLALCLRVSEEDQGLHSAKVESSISESRPLATRAHKLS